MLENILDMVKNYAEGAVATHPEIPDNKKQETVQATTEAVADGLKQNFNLSNLSGLTSLFNGGNKVSAGSSNPILGSIQTTLIHTLVQRVGLSQGIANSLASNIVPSLINSLMDRMRDPGQTEFNLDSLVGAFSGTDPDDQSGGGILETVGKLFGGQSDRKE